MPEKIWNSFTQTTAVCKRTLAVAAFFSLFINLLQLTVPIYMMQLLDRVLASSSAETLGFLSLIAVLALLTMAGLEIVRSRVLARTGSWFERALGFETFAQSVERKRGQKSYATEALSDLATVRAFLSSNNLNTLFDAPWIPIYLFIIFLLHPVLGLVATSGAAMLFALAVMNQVATKGPIQQTSRLSQKSFAKTMGAARNAEVVWAMGMLPGLTKRWYRDQSALLASNESVTDRTSAIHAASKLARFLVQLSILGVGTVLVLQEEMTPGVMIAGSIIMARALAPVEQAIGSWKSMASARASFIRLKAMFQEAARTKDTMTLPPPKGVLQAENVTFFFPGLEEPTVKAVNFNCEPGDAMAIIGPSASGKSTLAKLIIGTLEPSRGNMRLDGADIVNWDRDNLGEHVGYLPQDVELFAGTVQENIARMAEPDSQAVVEAAQLAGVHDMVLRLPQGYDTEIGDDGATISGGQRQLIGLARALYGKPKLIVLDEPNASLDVAGEQMLARSIVNMRKAGSTIIVVSHRPSILRVTNKVLVMRDGAVQMAGPTQAVMERLTGKPQQPKLPPEIQKGESAGELPMMAPVQSASLEDTETDGGTSDDNSKPPRMPRVRPATAKPGRPQREAAEGDAEESGEAVPSMAPVRPAAAQTGAAVIDVESSETKDNEEKMPSMTPVRPTSTSGGET